MTTSLLFLISTQGVQGCHKIQFINFPDIALFLLTKFCININENLIKIQKEAKKRYFSYKTMINSFHRRSAILEKNIPRLFMAQNNFFSDSPLS